MIAWLGVVAMVLGAGFVVIAALGVFRLPDLFTRMQAASKTGTAGAGSILLGTALVFSDAGVTATTLLVMGFLFLTAPVAAHLLARAGYFAGVPLHPSTAPDELKVHRERERERDAASPRTSKEPVPPAGGTAPPGKR